MPSVFSKYNSTTLAVVEQDSNSKPPYMRAGDPTPQTCVDWERACKRFANNKDIPADKIVKRTLDDIEDVRFVNWIELEREEFEAMTLEEFMALFRKTHLPNHSVDAVTLVTNIPAIVTEVKCTNVAIARGLVCTRCMSCKGYNLMKPCSCWWCISLSVEFARPLIYQTWQFQ